METLLVHNDIANEFLTHHLKRLSDAGVEIRGSREVVDLCVEKGMTVKPATEEDWREEYLDLILSVKVVPDLESAIDHIEEYGSHHTDAIVTNDWTTARRFQREVNSASVMVNASTRFSDGQQYGLGAEIGISTDKLHARGPMGLNDLVTTKYLVSGDGQVRV